MADLVRRRPSRGRGSAQVHRAELPMIILMHRCVVEDQAELRMAEVTEACRKQDLNAAGGNKRRYWFCGWAGMLISVHAMAFISSNGSLVGKWRCYQQRPWVT